MKYALINAILVGIIIISSELTFDSLSYWVVLLCVIGIIVNSAIMGGKS